MKGLEAALRLAKGLSDLSEVASTTDLYLAAESRHMAYLERWHAKSGAEDHIEDSLDYNAANDRWQRLDGLRDRIAAHSLAIRLAHEAIVSFLPTELSEEAAEMVGDLIRQDFDPEATYNGDCFTEEYEDEDWTTSSTAST